VHSVTLGVTGKIVTFFVRKLVQSIVFRNHTLKKFNHDPRSNSHNPLVTIGKVFFFWKVKRGRLKKVEKSNNDSHVTNPACIIPVKESHIWWIDSWIVCRPC